MFLEQAGFRGDGGVEVGLYRGCVTPCLCSSLRARNLHLKNEGRATKPASCYIPMSALRQSHSHLTPKVERELDGRKGEGNSSVKL